MEEAVLYIIARDNGRQVFADLVAAQPKKLQYLARLAMGAKSSAAKWQLMVRPN
jgi:hypothetical protein